MKLNKIEPKYNSKSNPRIGLITLGSDFRIEKDFSSIIYGRDIDLYVNRIPIIFITVSSDFFSLV